MFLFLPNQVKSQTLIMNEVSNGPSGNQEYVELAVVSNVVTYDCNSSTPPCIDIRGWIFDDNSGYHGTAGIAVGAVRFSQDPIWACVPLGTIILIYNDLDRNPAIPADDLSMSDGNCKIIAPLSSTLFESNATTPGAIACSYPSTGWTSGGNWANTLLANTGDCARIVDLAGCEVFSVCWATDNQNNLIYFNSAGSGSQNVWYFSGGDPSLQANWTEGIASPSPGDQTPGIPNNAANASYIGQFNNNCLPITPIVVTATSINAGCTCNGSATASATGSIAGYTFTWYDASYTPIGQTGATASGLCAGVYNVIGVSSIGCPDTATVTITSSSTLTVTSNSQTICAGASATLTATPSAAGGTFLWAPGGQTTAAITASPATTTTYTVTYNLSGCTSINTGVITVNPSPSISTSFEIDSAFCNQNVGSITNVDISGGSGNYSYQWFQNSVLIGTDSVLLNIGSGNYSLMVSDLFGCIDSSVVIFVPSTSGVSVSLNAIPSSGTEPFTTSVIATSVNATNYMWYMNNSFIVSEQDSILDLLNLSQGVYSIMVVALDNNGCSDTASLNILVDGNTQLQIPNIFTPNGDNINELFSISAVGYEQLILTIYDRWGLLMAEINSLNPDWDSRTTSGKLAPDGTYYYILKATDKKNIEKKYTGYFQLQR